MCFCPPLLPALLLCGSAQSNQADIFWLGQSVKPKYCALLLRPDFFTYAFVKDCPTGSSREITFGCLSYLKSHSPTTPVIQKGVDHSIPWLYLEICRLSTGTRHSSQHLLREFLTKEGTCNKKKDNKSYLRKAVT